MCLTLQREQNREINTGFCSRHRVYIPVPPGAHAVRGPGARRGQTHLRGGALRRHPRPSRPRMSD